MLTAMSAIEDCTINYASVRPLSLGPQDGAVVSAAASQQECMPSLCGICMFLRMYGYSHSPKTCIKADWTTKTGLTVGVSEKVNGVCAY